MVVFTYDDRALDLFVLADELADRGWRRPERSARAIGPATLGPELVEVVGALAPKELTAETVAAIAVGLGFVNALAEAAPVPVREALFPPSSASRSAPRAKTG